MKPAFRPEHGWGPDGKRAALSITFDNFGEAAEVELGLWGDTPIGNHHSVAFIPRLIDLLGGVRATYFIEACNTAIYPEAITAWSAAGHEVGLHAWRHENWEQTPAPRRRLLLRQSLTAMHALGVEPIGFRPPGGRLPREAWEEFKAAGLLYCSEAGDPGVGVVGGVISLPFAWRDVDVYMIEEVLGFMRVRCGDPEMPFGIPAWRDSLDGTLAAAVAEGGHRTVIFHPNFLSTSEDKLDVLRHLIAAATRQDVWLAPTGAVAKFVAGHGVRL
jgi:hypothetical protein